MMEKKGEGTDLANTNGHQLHTARILLLHLSPTKTGKDILNHRRGLTKIDLCKLSTLLGIDDIPEGKDAGEILDLERRQDAEVATIGKRGDGVSDSLESLSIGPTSRCGYLQHNNMDVSYDHITRGMHTHEEVTLEGNASHGGGRVACAGVDVDAVVEDEGDALCTETFLDVFAEPVWEYIIEEERTALYNGDVLVLCRQCWYECKQ